LQRGPGAIAPLAPLNPALSVICVHRCRSRQIFGVRRIFVRISPNLPENFLGHFLCGYFLTKSIFGAISSKQSTLGAICFQIKRRWAPFLLICSSSLPRFSGILRRFSQILSRFLRILPGFSGILPGFSPNQKFWECACTSCTPASYTTVRVLVNC